MDDDPSNFAAAWDGTEGTEKYTGYTLSALNEYGENLLNPEVQMKDGGFLRYCRRYNKLDSQERKTFWVSFISGLSEFESSFNTKVKYKESFSNNGKPVVSRGLLQMSIGSVNNKFYDCQIKKESDLHNAELNLRCAVKIMNYWINKDKRIYGRSFYKKDGKQKTRWYGVARYWAPIRLERYSGSKKRKYEKLGESLNDMGICR